MHRQEWFSIRFFYLILCAGCCACEGEKAEGRKAMDLDQVELTLLPAPDDPERVCYEIQAKLLGIHENLRKHGVGVTSVVAHPAGDTHIGQFIITLGPAAIAAIAAIAGAWVQTRFGRRIRLKFDEVEAEARTIQAIDELLKRVSAFRDSKQITGADRL
jgi:hypothetical protein